MLQLNWCLCLWCNHTRIVFFLLVSLYRWLLSRFIFCHFKQNTYENKKRSYALLFYINIFLSNIRTITYSTTKCLSLYPKIHWFFIFFVFSCVQMPHLYVFYTIKLFQKFCNFSVLHFCFFFVDCMAWKICFIAHSHISYQNQHKWNEHKK